MGIITLGWSGLDHDNEVGTLQYNRPHSIDLLSQWIAFSDQDPHLI